MTVTLRLNGDTITEWVCDTPDCGKTAAHVWGFVRWHGSYVLCTSCYHALKESQ